MFLNGKKIAKTILQGLKTTIKKQKTKPCLAVILIGEDPGSIVYVRLKEKAAREIGIKFVRFDLKNNVSQKKVLDLIKKLNSNSHIHGIIVQFPLSKHLNSNLIAQSILPEKDVDGFGKQSYFSSPAHLAILKLIQAAKGKKPTYRQARKTAVIISKNPIFAQPLAELLIRQKIKSQCVYLVNGKIKNSTAVKKADIVVVAIGKPHFIKPTIIKKNAIIIDVGYNRVNNKPAGDVDPKVSLKASYFSPVPGGIGPLSVAFLLKNTYLSAKFNN
ncbi:MAG: bifunctional 5,10-methylenetetrahydrofolate dehydrogenase/5,10-methenyltetrahydrofolate cyclohydrolase [Patescibacteria group bacterium]|nr:bifunctional 5,10-methylenetetrahydrofolate dehydrogenase/5,10-methenyltetrahydrofolate cyclohydrolase [Patescibacteria group bacterium]